MVSERIALGIDIGGTLTKLGLVNEKGDILASEVFSTPSIEKFDDYVSHIKLLSDSLLRKTDVKQLFGVGIGAPNANFKRGTIEYAPNLIWKGILPLAEKIKEKFDTDNIITTNDANVAAIGEMNYGNAKGMTNFIVITLGTGLGAGIVVEGELLYGHDCYAGELGHLVVEHNGREAKSGKRGALEAYVSSTALKRTILYMLADSVAPSRFRSVAPLDIHGEDITKAANEGDVIAQRAFEYTGEKLGVALANFVAFSQPEAIFLLGGLAKSGALLFDPTKKYMNQHLLEIYKGKVKVLESGLKEKNPAILGAASLIFTTYKN